MASATAQARPPAVAGSFYPGDPASLRNRVDELLAGARRPAPGADIPKALIAPHAGYVYSGPIAASAYARLEGARGRIRRVVLLGPAHRVPVRGLAAPRASAFATPLGVIPIDGEALARLASLGQVRVSDAAHALEHSLEVQLPFLQRALGEFSLVPLAVGDASGEEVAEVLEHLWGGSETLIVISSDLSHYLPYGEARALDVSTTRAIEELRGDAIGIEQACGRIPIQGLLAVAQRRGMSVETLDLRNSGDTAGSRDEVVGYGAWAFSEREPEKARKAGGDDLSTHREVLLRVARDSIGCGLSGRELALDPADFPSALRRPAAVFVTLHRDGQLRGCTGTLEAREPLVCAVGRAARRTALQDTRFEPVSAEELPKLAISISGLSPLAPLPVASREALLAALRPGRDGLVIREGFRAATFLPAVWESLRDPRDFVSELLAKAGLPRDHWSPALRCETFEVEEIH